jgi:methyl acetate hydrolase
VDKEQVMAIEATVDQVLQRAVEAGEVAGVVALAADTAGIVYQDAFGRRAIDAETAMTLDTVFWIASMTKTVTTVAAMQLVEQGKLDLDEPLGTRLPELATPQVLTGFDASGTPQLRPAATPITLRRLLSHTAGFTYHMWNADMGRYHEQTGTPYIGECKNAALAVPLVFDPGTQWQYGINIDWTGKAIEQASGQSLDAYLQTYIFQPLGMKDTGFVIGPDQRSRLSAMHARNADGSLVVIPFELPQEPELFMGGGGLYSTGPDYLTFLQMLLGGGRLGDVQVLRPESVAAMRENQIGDLSVGAFKTAEPGVSNDGEFFPGMVKKWGLGGMLTTADAPDGRSAGSLSWCGLGNTYYWLDPVTQIAGLILTQILPFLDAKVLALAERFEAAIYAGRPAPAVAG